VSGRLSRLIARHRGAAPLRLTARACDKFSKAWHNFDYDIRTNGEVAAIERLRGLPVRVIFDVGANVGDWTLAAARVFPEARVHAFEISPQTHAQLASRCAGSPGVRCESVGLSDAEGQITIRHYQGASVLTTAVEYPHALPYVEVAARTMRGDDYCLREGVEHIDILKVDVEGMEHRVFAGFEGMLRRGGIDVIQFEYGRVNILTKQLLRDFCSFFADRGYEVGKVYPRGVDFRPYRLDDEDFIGPNYIACRSGLAEHARLLRGRGDR
jgi:FkbM family methyltransferase